ncbi:MAG TPA: YjdF family protein [Lachnospiraceae bacterium]|nr:YjdF family protein [Lachnospiraceae bacterium]
MDKVSVRLQVFFENQFWIGICERIIDDKLSVSRIVFGAEPKDYEVEEYLLKYWYQLRFSPTIDAVVESKEKVNPKRRQREVKKQLQDVGIGTKSQQALKLQQEQCKMVRKTRTREMKEEEKERQFLLKQEKRKEKHRGR